MIAALLLGIAGTDALAAKKNKSGKDPQQEKRVDLDGEYHAALGIQTNTVEWLYRLGYYHDEYYGTEEWSRLCTGTYGTDECEMHDGEFQDVVIAGNGTYTVSLENADFMGETSFSQLQVATDIPDTGAITFSDMIVRIDGVTKATFAEPYMDKDDYAGGNCTLLAINDWREDLQGMNGECVPTGKENKIEITFTVSGFNYDKADEQTVDDGTVTETPDASAAQSSETVASSENSADSGTVSSEQEKEAPVAAVIVIIVVAVAAIAAVVVHVTRGKNR